MASAVLSGVANLFSMVGYECIAVAGDNYKLRRRFLRLSGFLIFLSGKGSILLIQFFAVLIGSSAVSAVFSITYFQAWPGWWPCPFSPLGCIMTWLRIYKASWALSTFD